MKRNLTSLLKAAKYDAGLHLSMTALCAFATIFHSPDLQQGKPVDVTFT